MTEADSPNLLRDGEPLTFEGASKSGDKPRPIRKKAFYRAWKRKELWAVCAAVDQQVKEGMRNLANEMAKVIYDPNVEPGTAYVMWPCEGNE